MTTMQACWPRSPPSRRKAGSGRAPRATRTKTLSCTAGTRSIASAWSPQSRPMFRRPERDCGPRRSTRCGIGAAIRRRRATDACGRSPSPRWSRPWRHCSLSSRQVGQTFRSRCSRPIPMPGSSLPATPCTVSRLNATHALATTTAGMTYSTALSASSTKSCWRW